MKAASLTKYGSPYNLEIREVDKVAPVDGEVSVRVHASSVNDWDWCITKGSPFYIRLFCGLFRPKTIIPGVDISGVIEAVGSHAAKFEPGDAVYGDLSECGFGGFAEYVCVPETALSPKPAGVSFVDAAAIPHAATLALQGLRDVGGLKPQGKLLINGAGGGVGTIGLQVARALGVENVTGVDHKDKLEMMRSQGFDEVLDYAEVDFTSTGNTYDLILDAKTDRSPLNYLRALNPGGRYVTVGGKIIRIIQVLLLKPIIKLFSQKRVRLVSLKTNQDLDLISEWLEAGKIVPVIEGPYKLCEVQEAVQRFGEGRHKGKIIISMEQGS